MSATTAGSLACAPAAVHEGCSIPASLKGVDVERIPTSKKIVALTFDGGASAAGVPKIRRVLRDRDVRATFFLTGDFVRTYPKKSRRLADEWVVGNHSNTHPDFTTLSDAAVRRQVRRAEATIVDVAGENPRPYFRFPFGARDERTIALVNDLCYVPVRWTVDTLGWQGTSGGRSAASVVARVRDNLAPGAIVLMHVGAHPTDGSTLDADALGQVIDMIRAHGYRLVSLRALLPATP